MLTWHCPTCSAPNPLPEPDEAFRCRYCRSRLGPGSVACRGCGEVWPEAVEHCPECDEALSPVAQIFARHAEAGGPPRWLDRARQQAGLLQASELAESEQRMNAFLEQEERRLAELWEERQAQASRERTVVLAGLAGVMLLALLAVAGLLLARVSP